MPAVDDDIRADFLVEAGDLIEKLGGQLVELESRPDDTDLLNAIFRAFHTVKGGAGFLGIGPLVELCHATEDVFNALRNGKRAVDAALMDAVLQAVDLVQAMMASVSEGREPQGAPPALIEGLHALLDDAPAASPEKAAEAAPVAASSSSDTITDDEFDALLDQLEARKKQDKEVSTPAPKAKGAKDLITDDEFDALLDQLNAEKKSAKAPALSPPAKATPAHSEPTPKAPAAAPAAASTPTPPAETSVRVDTVKLDR
ncbi:MAG: Hpt domain-containing protein, partial [Panacagrimonas sp.]